MTKISAPSALTREALPDAPDGEWLDSMLEKINMVDDQVTRALQGGFGIGDNTPWQFRSLNMQHGIEYKVKNPFADQSMPVKIISVVSAVGLVLDAAGKPAGSTYTIMQPQLGWRPTGQADNSVFITVQYAPPLANTPQSSFINRNNAVTAATGVDKIVTSITLGSGVWIADGIGLLTGALTGTTFKSGITTASSLPADATAYGDAAGKISTVSNVNSDESISIPGVPLTLAASTVLNLISNAAFSAGTPGYYGVLRARCVAPDPATTGRVTLLFQGA